jgi:hypothetical protein
MKKPGAILRVSLALRIFYLSRRAPKIATAALLVLLIAAAAHVYAHASEPGSQRFVDDLDRTGRIPHAPRRIISLAPSITDCCWVLGSVSSVSRPTATSRRSLSLQCDREQPSWRAIALKDAVGGQAKAIPPIRAKRTCAKTDMRRHATRSCRHGGGFGYDNYSEEGVAKDKPTATGKMVQSHHGAATVSGE